MPIAKGRLDYPDPKDAERLMMELWAAENVRQPWLNINGIPLDPILHECTEQCRQEQGKNYVTHHFTGKLPDRDVRIAAATVQWLATNCGREFLMRFFDSIGHKVILAAKERAA